MMDASKFLIPHELTKTSTQANKQISQIKSAEYGYNS